MNAISSPTVLKTSPVIWWERLCRLCLVFAIAIAIGFVATASAQTSVSSNITRSERWTAEASPYLLSGHVSIQGGAVLTLDPGVVVYMAANSELAVEAGRLISAGTFERPVQLLSEKVRNGVAPAAGDWGRLSIAQGGSGSSFLFTKISHGKGVHIQGAAVSFDAVSIVGHAGPAISADLVAELTGSGNQAFGNEVNAAVLPAGDITAVTRFGLRGIPYLVQSGVLSVGESPSIHGVTPSSVLAGETATVTVSGKRLQGAILPQWSLPGVLSEVLPGGTDTSIALKVGVPIDAVAGGARLTLLTDAGEVSKADALVVQRNQPRITSIAPSRVYSLSGSHELVIDGNFITNKSVVELDGQTLSTRYLSGSQLVAELPEQIASGQRFVRLRTPDPVKEGAFLISNAMELSVLQAQAVFSPTSASMISGGVETVEVRLPFDAPAGGVTFSLTSNAPAIASVQPSVTIPEGGSAAAVQVRGASVGETQIVMSRSGWGNAVLPVAVIEPPVPLDYHPITSSLVGVSFGSNEPPVIEHRDPVHSQLVGVGYGAYANHLQPSAGGVGTTVMLQIRGQGLHAVSAVQLLPADGLIVGVPTANLDGTALTVKIEIDESAPKSVRQVVLTTASGNIEFSSSMGDRFTVAAPAPRLDSITPNVLIAGQGATSVRVRGQYLRDIQGISFTPSAGIEVISLLTANAEGTQLDFTVQVAADAPIGPRTAVVATAGGESSEAAAIGNTVQIAREAAGVFESISSPLVGIAFGSDAVPQEQAFGPYLSAPVGVEFGALPVEELKRAFDPVVSRSVDVLVGAAAFNIVPAAGSVGSSVPVVVNGVGLSQVTGVALYPADGVAVRNVRVNATGTQIMADVVIDADAAKTTREVILQTADLAVPAFAFLKPSSSQFLITAPVPVLDGSITPQVIVAGAPHVDVTVRGRNLREVKAIRFEPEQGISMLGTAVPSADGTSMLVSVQASADAAQGPRTMIVVTAAGESSPEPSPANTLMVAQETAGAYEAIASAQVGVLVDALTPPGMVAQSVHTEAVGVVVGAGVSAISPVGAVKESSGQIVFRGAGLTGVTEATLQIPDSVDSGVSLGQPLVNADGTEVSVPFTVDAGAPSARYQVALLVGESVVPAMRESAMQWRVLTPPVITSFSPIVLLPGNPHILEIRGSNLHEVEQVLVVPGGGIEIFPGTLTWSSDGLGEKLSVRVSVAPDAEPGARVLRLVYPSGMSSGQSAVNNTLTVQIPS